MCAPTNISPIISPLSSASLETSFDPPSHLSDSLKSKKSHHLYRRLKSQTIPTSHLFIGNCGVKTGFTRDDIVDLFTPYGRVESIVIGEGYSFVSLDSVDNAVEASKYLEGKVIDYCDERLPNCPPPIPAPSNPESTAPKSASRRFVRRPLSLRFCERALPQSLPLAPCSRPIPESVSCNSVSSPGLRYSESILTEDECNDLLNAIDQMPWETRLKRRVQHYG